MKIDIYLTSSLFVIYIGWIVWLLWSADSTPMQIAGIVTMALGCALAVVAIVGIVIGLFWSVLRQAEKEAAKEALPKFISFKKRF